MSLHPSLATEGKTKKQRTVLKRIEKIKHLMEKDLWKEGDSVFNLPKIKLIRLKLKKEKPKADAEEGAEGEAPVEGAVKPAAAEKPAADSKKADSN